MFQVFCPLPSSTAVVSFLVDAVSRSINEPVGRLGKKGRPTQSVGVKEGGSDDDLTSAHLPEKKSPPSVMGLSSYLSVFNEIGFGPALASLQLRPPYKKSMANARYQLPMYTVMAEEGERRR